MPTTGTRHSYRYIDIDWRDDTSGVPVWRLVVDGTHVATAVVADSDRPAVRPHRGPAVRAAVPLGRVRRCGPA
jgi:hypothetical protein